jgi:positive regulator of sigma E activity
MSGIVTVVVFCVGMALGFWLRPRYDAKQKAKKSQQIKK